MPCCKAEKFENWCEGEELFEFEGELYCVYHLPAASPDKPEPPNFNQKVFARIDAAKKEQTACNLSGAVFPGDVEFGQYGKDNPLPAISFIKAAFSGYAYFREAAFSGDAYFIEAVFSGKAYFIRSRLQRVCGLQRSRLQREGVLRIEAAFSGKAYFDESRLQRGGGLQRKPPSAGMRTS